jgi:predicted nucleic acid-binding protein
LRVVVDTNVVAAVILLEARHAEEAARLLRRCRELLAPSHFRAELGNVIWKSITQGRYLADDAGALLDASDQLGITIVEVEQLWRGAVARAVAANHPVHDTLFVELAVRESTFVASFDEALCRRFPSVVRTPAALLD